MIRGEVVAQHQIFEKHLIQEQRFRASKKERARRPSGGRRRLGIVDPASIGRLLSVTSNPRANIPVLIIFPGKTPFHRGKGMR